MNVGMTKKKDLQWSTEYLNDRPIGRDTEAFVFVSGSLNDGSLCELKFGIFGRYVSVIRLQFYFQDLNIFHATSIVSLSFIQTWGFQV